MNIFIKHFFLTNKNNSLLGLVFADILKLTISEIYHFLANQRYNRRHNMYNRIVVFICGAAGNCYYYYYMATSHVTHSGIE